MPRWSVYRPSSNRGTTTVLHYAGHAFFDTETQRSGLKMHGGRISSPLDLPVDVAVPCFVFLSACESGRVAESWPSEEEVAMRQPLAETFLRAGVVSFAGTFFVVGDRAASVFAGQTYAALARGGSLGEAMRVGPQHLFDRHDPDWGNFMLFGDDSFVL